MAKEQQKQDHGNTTSAMDTGHVTSPVKPDEANVDTVATKSTPGIVLRIIKYSSTY